jgi:hypothetical protein
LDKTGEVELQTTYYDYELLREGKEMEKSISNIFLAKVTIHMLGLLNYLV